MITRRNRLTGANITVGTSEEVGMIEDSDYNWWTVCDTHSIIVCHPTKRLAITHSAFPEWCEECSKILIQKGML